MRERHRTLQRLLRVKSQLQEIEEARLNDIRREKSEVEEEQRALYDLLGDGQRNDPLILGLACNRLTGAERREAALSVEEKAQKDRVLQRTAQAKALEKIVKETARAISRDDEKKQLLEIGERLAVRDSSLPQV